MPLGGFPKLLSALSLATGLGFAACGDGGSGGNGGSAAQGGETATDSGGMAGLGGGDAPGTLECPVDILAAEGTDCSAFGDGALCLGGTGSKCGGGDRIACVKGVWQRQQALAIPC